LGLSPVLAVVVATGIAIFIISSSFHKIYGDKLSYLTKSATSGINWISVGRSVFKGVSNSSISTGQSSSATSNIIKSNDTNNNNNKVVILNCNGFRKEPQTDCRTYGPDGKLNYANRYEARSLSFDVIEIKDSFNNAEIFSDFVKIVNNQSNYNQGGMGL
jgi:hypothetical protein